MRFSPLCFLLCAALCIMQAPLIAAETVGPDIAVLRLDEVIRNSKVYIARVEQLKKEKAEAESQLGKMEEQLKSLDSNLQILSPNSEKFAAAQEDIEVIKVKRELLAKRVRSLLDRRHGAALKEAYDVAHGLLKAFAKERGIRLVTLAPNPDMPVLSSNDMQMQLGLQVSLYFDEKLDITEPFIAFMNSRYENSVPNVTPGPTPGPTTGAPKPVGP
jgi:Skp family chaperone for outer membrane proteins